MRVVAYKPEILKEFVKLFEVIMKRKSEIDFVLKWKIALIVSQTLKCPFCGRKLLPYLANLSGRLQKAKIASIFKETKNYMRSDYNLAEGY